MYVYKKMYLKLFNHVTDAITLLQNNDAEKALSLLISAQQEAEEIFMEKATPED